MTNWRQAVYMGLMFLWICAGLERYELHEGAIAAGIAAVVYGIVAICLAGPVGKA
jgi:hypothetical protein